MCTVNVPDGVAAMLADLMFQLREGVAEMFDADPDEITIGPVDFSDA